MILGSCASPLEKAQNICYQMGNPSPACIERQFNIERARADAYYQRERDIINSGSPPSFSQPSTESEYDRRVRKFEGQAKDRCESGGGIFKKYGTAWVCEKPQVSQPQQPQESEKCRNYAQRAIQQYQEVTNPLAERRGCNVNSSPRWSLNYQDHYNWCLGAQVEQLRSEEKARTDYINKCNRPQRIDP
jgi:hypothetical protein